MSASNLKQVSGNREDIKYYFQYNEPKVAHDKVKVLKNGQVFVGTYAGSFTNQWGKMNHRIRTEKGMIAVVGCSQLNKDMAKVEEGADVEVTFTGQYTIKDGAYKGKKGYSFNVRASSFIEPVRTTGVKAALKVAPTTTENTTELDTSDTEDENDPF